MFTDVIPAKYRKSVYRAYALGAVVLGVWQILGIYPDLRETATAVWAYLAAAFGLVAAGNTAVAAGKHAEGGTDSA